MNRAVIGKLILILCLVAAVAASALGAPTGANITVGTTEHGNVSSSTNGTFYPGNVTMLNITGTQITARWAGFYGFITGGIQLSDASSNKFYEWTITNFTGAVVYAANASVSNWDLRAINNSVAPPGVTAAGTDRFNNTFTLTATFQSISIGPISTTPYTVTYQGGSTGTLRTYGLVTNDNTINIWAGWAETNASSFKTGQKVDYQILAPAKLTGTTYNFYLELP